MVMNFIMEKLNLFKEEVILPNGRRITKEDIGEPRDFRHEAHIGWDSNGDWIEQTSTSAAMNQTVQEPNSTEEVTENIGPSEEGGRYEETVVDTENHKKVQRITKEDIGHPMDFRHKVHVGWDSFNGFQLQSQGEFMDMSVCEVLRKVGTSFGNETRESANADNSPPLPEQMQNFVQIFIGHTEAEPNMKRKKKPLPPCPKTAEEALDSPTIPSLDEFFSDSDSETHL